MKLHTYFLGLSIFALSLSISHAQTTLSGPDTVCAGQSESYFQSGGASGNYTAWTNGAYNVQGQLMQQEPLQQAAAELQWDVSGWPAGVYLVILKVDDGARHYQKIIVQP